MSENLESRFLEVINETYEEYKVSGERSNKKLKILHGWIRSELKTRLGNEYQIKGLSKNSTSELVVKGAYYDKRVDIGIQMNGKMVGVVSVKFALSSLQKNNVNYFEGQIGETANLRRNDIVFGHIFCVLQPVPVRRKDESIVKWENVNDSLLNKYRKLAEDKEHSHAPDVQAVCIFRRDVENNCVEGWFKKEYHVGVSQINLDYLYDNMGISRFFTQFVSTIQKKYNKTQIG